MQLIKEKENSLYYIKEYKTEIAKKEFIRDIIDSFAQISSVIFDIIISNEEQFEDAYSITYKTLGDFRLSADYFDKYIDSMNFNCVINNSKNGITLDFNDETLSIWQEKGLSYDFSPFLNEMEEKILLKKNSRMTL